MLLKYFSHNSLTHQKVRNTTREKGSVKGLAEDQLNLVLNVILALVIIVILAAAFARIMG